MVTNIQFTLSNGIANNSADPSPWRIKLSSDNEAKEITLNLHWKDNEWAAHTFIISHKEWEFINSLLLGKVL